MKTFILGMMLAVTAVTGTVVITDPAAAGPGKPGGVSARALAVKRKEI